MTQVLQDRIDRLRTMLTKKGLDAVILTSPENLRYFMGFTGHDCIGVICHENNELFVDSRYTEQAKEECPLTEVRLSSNGTARFVSEALNQSSNEVVGVEERNMSLGTFQGFESRAEGRTFKNASHALAELRVVKDASEIKLIEQAIHIADEAYRRMLEHVKPGVTETYLATVLEHEMRMLGASGTSFETIVASGYRGAMPHGAASDRVIEEGDGITFDFGCMYQGYCSDATRTVFVGEPSEEMRTIYEVVREAQAATCAALKPGMTGHEIDKIARDIIDEAGYGAYFGHSLGHSLGLLIHEQPGAAPGSEAVFEEGMFLTVEPGIYVPGVGGVRIEDTCIFTEDGARILTNLPKELVIIPVDSAS